MWVTGTAGVLIGQGLLLGPASAHRAPGVWWDTAPSGLSVAQWASGLPVWLRWLTEGRCLAGLGIASAVLALVSLLGLPWLLARIPADYFVVRRGDLPRGRFRWAVRGAKNLVGFVLLIAGIAMLVLPGQGILTLVAALILLDFPGKRRLERSIVSCPRVLAGINALRARAGQPPLKLGPEPEAGASRAP